ncbi:hypothetical protein M413DRAFT_30279 [Hebeloma cylindrosporum]|uniref:Uncharacterized protein n=1 Tax=Hebeloma cylindrosporum TaxID=76867 RepID=A0A0C3C3J0_HEBCY|nr:hypothetical protein M413DRAFT_30279 [Hebeloma cylindrosporum h7]
MPRDLKRATATPSDLKQCYKLETSCAYHRIACSIDSIVRAPRSTARTLETICGSNPVGLIVGSWSGPGALAFRLVNIFNLSAVHNLNHLTEYGSYRPRAWTFLRQKHRTMPAIFPGGIRKSAYQQSINPPGWKNGCKRTYGVDLEIGRVARIAIFTLFCHETFDHALRG